MYNYLRIYVKYYILSQLIFSPSHYKTRIIFRITCNNSEISYITRSGSCFCFITNKCFKKAFPGCDIYMFILTIAHSKSKIEFGLSISIRYLEILANETLNSLHSGTTRDYVTILSAIDQNST